MSYTELEHGYQGLRKAAAGPSAHFYVPDDCITGELELCGDEDGSEGSTTMLADSGGLIMGNVSDCSGMIDVEGGTPTSSSSHMCSKQVVVGICAMAKKSQSKPMKEILTRLQEFEYIKMTVFPEEVILKKPVEEWPPCDCLISFHSKGFPLDKAIAYAALHKPYVINNLHMQYDIQDRRRVYAILESEGIEIPRYAVLDRDSPDPKHHELVESEDHVEVNGIIFNKPFVEKPVSAEDHNIYIYYPTSAGGGSQRLFRKIGSRSSVYSPESRVRKSGSFIYEDFMPTDGTDVKVYTVGPDYAHAEARKSPALDGKVERDSEGKEIRYPVILSNAEKLISRKVCLAFKQAVCGFDLLRANGKSFVCDVNGFSFVKNSNKYYDDCAKILGNMILRELAPTLHIPWSVPFQLDDPPIVPTTFGKMMELRCVVAVIRHGDRTPKQKMKVEVRHPKFFEIFEKYDGYKHGHVKLKRPKQLQEILDIARSLLAEIAQREAQPEIEEKQGKLEQLKSVLEMYGHFSGINRKVQMKYQPRGRPRGSSSDDGKTPRSTADNSKPAEPSLVLILKWGGELTPAGRIQAEELGRIFRCMYPGGQGRHLSGEYAGTQGLGLLRLHSTFRHDLKIYASDEGRVQMTAAAFAKGLLALEGELTPILVQMVKSANTNGLLDNDCDSSKYQNMCKARLHELMQLEREFTEEERKMINPGGAESIAAALELVKNPARCCRHVHSLIHSLMDIVRIKSEDPKTRDAILYHGETWELMGRRWGKIEKDFCNKNKKFDISKIPDIYDCIKYDLQHNQHTLQFEQAEELYMYAKYLADIVIPQEYGLTVQEKLTIGQGICTPLLKKIRADLQRNIEEFGEEEETVNRLNPRYSHGVSSPGRHVRTRLYFTSESHVHSLLTVLRYGGLLDVMKDEQWRRAMQYISMVSELNYMSQLVVMLYEDPTKDPCSEERFHVELHFSPGVNCCVQKNLPPGPGFRPHSRSESATTTNSGKNSTAESTATSTPRTEECSSRIDEETETSADVTPTEDLSRRSSQSVTQTDSCVAKSPIEEKVFRHKHKQSDPIPIGSCHTVCGHEAAHLAKRLTAELAQQQQAQQSGRSLTSYDQGCAISPECEPRARSYDQQHQDTSPNADMMPVISENTLLLSVTSAPLFHSISSPEFFIADPNVIDKSFNCKRNCSPTPPITIQNTAKNTFDYPVNNSQDFYCNRHLQTPYSLHDYYTKSPTNDVPLSELKFTKEIINDKFEKIMPESATNELPLTEIKFMSSSRQLDQFQFPDGKRLPMTVPIYDSTKGSSGKLSYSDPNIIDVDEDLHGSRFKSMYMINNMYSYNTFPTRSSSHPAMSLLSVPSASRKFYRSHSLTASGTSSDEDYVEDDSQITFDLMEMDRRISLPDDHFRQMELYAKPSTKRSSALHRTMATPTSYVVRDVKYPRRSFSHPMTSSFHTIQHPHLHKPRIHHINHQIHHAQSYNINSNANPTCTTMSSITTLRNSVPKTIVTNTEANGAGTTGALCEGVGGGNGGSVGVGGSGGTTAMNIRRHRHSIAGQMSYFKMLGFGFGGPLGFKKLGVGASSTSSLFSTAVISGSSSAPNLRDMIPTTASASAIEGFGGVPPIRPLETLHNALSLRQLDEFLERMTSTPMPRTPTSSPPKNPSTPILTPTPSSSQLDRCLLTSSSDILSGELRSGINATNVDVSDSNLPVFKPNISSSATAAAHAVSLKLQSPCNSIGWSGPPSFVSSSGPSSPTGLSDFCSRESSDMSASIISSDGCVGGTKVSQMFPSGLDLDGDLSNVGMTLGSVEALADCKGEVNSGEITPVSAESEFDFNTGDATAGSTADTDVTVTEDLFDETSIAPLPIDQDSQDVDNLVVIEKKRAASFSYQSHDSTSYQFPNFYNNIFPAKSNISTSSASNSASNLDMKDVKCNAYKRQNSTPITLDQFSNNSKYDKECLNESKNLFTSDKKWTNYKEKFLVSKVTTPTEAELGATALGSLGSKNTELLEKNIILGNNLNESRTNVNKCEKMELKNMKMLATPGAIVVKETFIEPPKINRVSSLNFPEKPERNFDTSPSNRRASSSDVNDLGETSTSNQHQFIHNVYSPKIKNQNSRRSTSEYEMKKINTTSPSRPATGPSSFSENLKKASEQPVKSQRFTTTLVDEKNLGITQPRFASSPENRADIFAANLSTEKGEASASRRSFRDDDDTSSLSTTPVLTLASSLTDQPSITHGFKIRKDESYDKE